MQVNKKADDNMEKMLKRRTGAWTIEGSADSELPDEKELELLCKIAEKELQLEKVMEENKKMQKIHRLELEKRDRKEMVMLVVVAVCVLIYACVALATRGFV